MNAQELIFEQYEPVILKSPDDDLVRTASGALFTGTAQLYILPPNGDPLQVAPVAVSVVSGAWEHTVFLSSDGEYRFQIRSESGTHGSSKVHTISVNPSPFRSPQ